MAKVEVKTYVDTDGDQPNFIVQADLAENDAIYLQPIMVRGEGDTIDAASRRFWRNLKEHFRQQEKKAS